MFLCYVDESGDAGPLNPHNVTDTPLFLVAGLIISQAALINITHDYLALKQRFYPSLSTKHYLDSILYDLKGAKLREYIRKGNRRNWTHSIGFIDSLINLLFEYDVKLIAQILIKGIDVHNSDAGFYGHSIQRLCSHFQHYLHEKLSPGHVIADSRRKAQNLLVSHAIFTQVFKTAGNRYPNFIEMPTYGHASNHVVLQLADILASAVLFPMASHVYCQNINNVHVHPKFATLHGRYKNHVRDLQYRYVATSGYWDGGVDIMDGTGQKRRSRLLFAPPQ